MGSKLDEVKMQALLDVIRRLESTDGQNVEHKTMESGLHQGSSAIGEYGLMPNTVREIANRARKDKSLTPEMDMVSRMPEEAMKNHLNANPHIQRQFAEKMARRLMEKHMGSEEKVAEAWLKGHNIPTEKLTDEQLNSSDRVKKFKEERMKMFPLLYKEIGNKDDTNFSLPEEVKLDLEKFQKGDK